MNGGRGSQRGTTKCDEVRHGFVLSGFFSLCGVFLSLIQLYTVIFGRACTSERERERKTEGSHAHGDGTGTAAVAVARSWGAALLGCAVSELLRGSAEGAAQRAGVGGAGEVFARPTAAHWGRG